MVATEPDETTDRCPTCGTALPEAGAVAAAEGLAADRGRSSASPASVAEAYSEDSEVTS